MTGKKLEIAMYALIAVTSLFTIPEKAEAGFYRRQYYSSWSYRPRRRYYYTRYYYRPVVRTRTYSYHYVIYYPSRPRYRYYYNPVRRVYWGRYEVDAKGKPLGYSMLKPEDRKSSLEAIPEFAFPKPTNMPAIPESKDGEEMAPPPSIDVDAVKNEYATKKNGEATQKNATQSLKAQPTKRENSDEA